MAITRIESESGVRSAMRAANQLSGRGPTDPLLQIGVLVKNHNSLANSVDPIDMALMSHLIRILNVCMSIRF